MRLGCGYFLESSLEDTLVHRGNKRGSLSNVGDSAIYAASD